VPGAQGHSGQHRAAGGQGQFDVAAGGIPPPDGRVTTTTGKRYLLTAFTPADPAKIASGWDISANGVFKSLDFANVQGYDFPRRGFGQLMGAQTGPGTRPTFFRDSQDPYPFEFSISKAIQTYLDAGVTPAGSPSASRSTARMAGRHGRSGQR
jgi:chitinase